MTSEIRVNTFDLRQGSQSLNGVAGHLGDVQAQVSSLSLKVGDAYNGELRQALDRIVGGELQTGLHLQSRAHELGVELLGRANAFETANQASFSSITNMCMQFQGSMLDVLPSSSIVNSSDQSKAKLLFGMAGLSGAAAVTTFLKPYSPLIKSGIESVDNSLELLQEGMSYSGFREIGRNLNLLVGNKKAGYVGLMDKTGHLINKNALFKYGAVSFGFGVASDLLSGDHWTKAIGSEAIEAGIDYAIFATPIVGQVYLGMKIGMAFGQAAAGVMDAVGMHEEATVVQNTLDQLDFTDRIGDAIMDFVANPPNFLSEPGVS